MKNRKLVVIDYLIEKKKDNYNRQEENRINIINYNKKNLYLLKDYKFCLNDCIDFLNVNFICIKFYAFKLVRGFD